MINYTKMKHLSKKIKNIQKMLKILKRCVKIERWFKSMTPFELLISTILSQNTNRENTRVGFKNLKNMFGVITPEKVLSASAREIKNRIKPAGLYNEKAKRIKEIAKIIVKRYNGDLNKLLTSKDARNELLKLPGVGEKTADVMLTFVGKVPAFPVDTHIFRIAKRWMLVKGKASYRDVSESFKKIVPPKDRLYVHLLLIEFGRDVCRAVNPNCNSCPVKTLCNRYPR